MTPDSYTRRAARLMVERYGEGAGREARKRATALLAAGDTGGAAACRAMVKTIDELQHARPAADPRLLWRD